MNVWEVCLFDLWFEQFGAPTALERYFKMAVLSGAKFFWNPVQIFTNGFPGSIVSWCFCLTFIKRKHIYYDNSSQLVVYLEATVKPGTCFENIVEIVSLRVTYHQTQKSFHPDFDCFVTKTCLHFYLVLHPTHNALISVELMALSKNSET